MPKRTSTLEALRGENDALRARLAEAESTLEAIRTGEVDAVVVHGKAGHQIYQLQSAEAASNQFRGEVLSQIHDAVIAVDNTYHIIYFNPAAEEQYTVNASRVLGHKLDEVFHRRWPEPGGEAAFLTALQKNGYWRGDSIHIKRNGEEIHVESSVRQLHDLTGAPSGLLAVIRDITSRKRAEAGLLEAQAQLKQHAENLEQTVAERTIRLRETIGELEAFSYSIAHDLRAPLRAMNSFGLLLRDEYADRLDDTGRDYLQRICVAAARLDMLIRDVLNYTVLLHTPTALTPVELDRLIQDILRTYPDLQADNVKIEVASPLPRAIGHEGFLTQCIANLLGNAIKFVAPGVPARVKIRAERSADFLRLYFQDNGIGIAPHNQERIFQMFERGQADSSYRGTGIGLAIVKKAAERMGGRVGCESTPGQGSTFWLELRAA